MASNFFIYCVTNISEKRYKFYPNTVEKGLRAENIKGGMKNVSTKDLFRFEHKRFKPFVFNKKKPLSVLHTIHLIK